jgi:nicotinamide-nucleotide amidase
MQKTGEVEIILVGNELLKGERQDAHLSFIGNAMARIGVRVTGAHVIGDDRAEIAGLISDRTDNARVIVVSGGLGPTHDDVTREGVADGLGLELEFRDNEWQTIRKIFTGFGREPDESNRRQAFFPKGAVALANPKGTAAGFMVDMDDLLVAVLPGPPRELRPMLENTVVSRVNAIFGRPPVFKRTFRTTGIGESAMTPNVAPIFDEFDEFVVSSLPHLGGVDIVITQRPDVSEGARLRERADAFEVKLREVLGHHVYATGTESLEAAIGEALAARGETVAVAESLTGGLIGKRFTATPGSSRYFLADVVAYSNAAKESFIAVSGPSLEAHGAVSEVVCREMADGVRKATGATWALASTGIAGPDGGTKEKPVGLAYYGLSWDGDDIIKHRVFPGSREDVRERVVWAALFLLFERLQSEAPR